MISNFMIEFCVWSQSHIGETDKMIISEYNKAIEYFLSFTLHKFYLKKKMFFFSKTRKFVSSSLKYAILCARVSALPFPATSVSSELQSCNRLIHCGTLLMRRWIYQCSYAFQCTPKALPPRVVDFESGALQSTSIRTAKEHACKCTTRRHPGNIK